MFSYKFATGAFFWLQPLDVPSVEPSNQPSAKNIGSQRNYVYENVEKLSETDSCSQSQYSDLCVLL